MTHPDTAARAHVEGIRMVGPYHHYGIHEPVAVGDNDNLSVAPQPAGDWYAVGNPEPQFFRRGDWMQTYTGLRFWPLNPRPEDVDIRDIAHALSMQCRYGGHSLRFYSVAEHCVHIARFVSPANALWGLLHDAAEAYLADVPRPLKRHLPGYKEAEAKVMAAICQHFDLPPEMPAEVHAADNRILSDEVHQNMSPMPWHSKHNEPIGVVIECWPPEVAEANFLEAFRDLQRKQQQQAWRRAA